MYSVDADRGPLAASHPMGNCYAVLSGGDVPVAEPCLLEGQSPGEEEARRAKEEAAAAAAPDSDRHGSAYTFKDNWWSPETAEAEAERKKQAEDGGDAAGWLLRERSRQLLRHAGPQRGGAFGAVRAGRP